MALYHKWDVKNDFTYVLQFFSLIYDSLGSVSVEFAEKAKIWGQRQLFIFIQLLSFN